MKRVVEHKRHNSSAEKKSSSSNHKFPIVAIGASAGGLEAITELLKYLIPDTGMAFIYVQHLSPDHKSMLSSLMAKATSMKVQEAENKEKMLPNHVYVIPPDKEMKILDGKIKITPRPETPRVNLPIDILFSSLADTHKENVIGIILSGSATDGTRGMKAIKHEGGLTFAQDDTAKFNSMPKSAIAAGVVDFVLSPRKIAQEISRLSRHPYIKSNGTKTHKEDEIDDSHPALKTILGQLHKVQDVDFSQYKMTTVKRRIMRRMLLYKIKSLKEYATLLKEKNDEVGILYQDLLINVTSFFRDTEAHQYLKTTLLPKLLKSKKPDKALRIWVPACATGEEAYSIAIILLEIQSNQFTNIPVQIFATDLDGNAIAKARVGDYSKNELEEVSPKRLQRFYTKSLNGYRVAKQVRDMCVFAQHNVLSDPPFARVDFISCCNLLIYLDSAAQKKAIATFHYALNDPGFLMLGKSETVGQAPQLFSVFNKRHKIYSRRNLSGPRPLPVLTPRFAQPQAEINLSLRERKTVKSNFYNGAGLDKAIDAVLLSRFIPASVIINEQMEILQFRGATDLYIAPSTGRASLNILKMTRPEIAFELRSAISKAIKSKQSVHKTGIELKLNNVMRSISIEVVPLKIEWDEPVLLVLFSEQQRAEIISDNAKDTKHNSAAKERRIKKLEEELEAARIDMLAYSQEQEAYSEELQSANEEVVSSNEELQTINEELETSKEEIESVNEELSTTNEELQTRNELLKESYDYVEAVNSTIREAMLVLDKDLRVKLANKSFYETFDLRPEETEGVLLYDLGKRQWNIPKLRELLEEIIPKNSRVQDFEVKHDFEAIGQKIMLCNASRIIQKAHHEQLILLSITDITDIRRIATLQAKIDSEQELRRIMEDRLEAEKKILELFHFIADAMPQKVWTADEHGTRNYFNKQWLDYTGKSLEELQNEGWKKIIHPDDLSLTDKLWRQSVATGNDFEVEDRKQNKKGEYKWHLSRAIAIKDDTGKIIMWVGTNTEMEKQKIYSFELEKAVVDRTYELQNANELLEEKNTELQKINKELEAFTYVSSHDLQEPLRKIQTFSERIMETEEANLSKTGRNYLERMRSTASRMQALIEDLLSYSRLNFKETKFRETDLNLVLEEVKTELKETIEEKQATIDSTGLGEANIIRFQFRQLLLNLISNALKFSRPQQPPHIVIKSEIKTGYVLKEPLLSPEIKYCHISIADNGIGFEPEFKQKIFEVFQKLHSKEEYAGTGIGLAIVKKIVENHKGFITATGEPDKGATFNIYLPAS